MRLFVAILFPDDLKEKLQGLMRGLAAACPADKMDIKWTTPDQLHYTLKFIGNVSEVQRETLLQALDTVAQDTAPFEITVGGMGRFPKKGIPQSLWVGAQEGKQDLENLAGRMEAALAPVGFPKENRPYVPHVTLGRLRRLSNMAILQTPLNQHKTLLLGTLKVRSFALMQSKLSSTGSEYTVLHVFSLRDPNS